LYPTITYQCVKNLKNLEILEIVLSVLRYLDAS
jgi:hypothetical protein